MRRPLRVGIRTRLLLAAVGAVAIALIIGVTAFNLFLGQRLTASQVSLARAQATAELSALEVVDGKLVSPEGVDRGTAVGSPVWVFAGETILEKPRVPRSLTTIASSLAGGPERTLRVKESIRLYALPVTHNGERIGTVVAGVPLAAYDETATIAFVGSVVLAVALLAAVAVLSHWILGKALLPVSRMTDDAAAWSDHDLDRRFDRGEPYDELTRLAATLDALLERLSASLRHEQRLTAELSHELRTPLAKISAETELALRTRAHERRLPRQPRGSPPQRGADDAYRRGARLGRPAGSRPDPDHERCPGRRAGRGRGGSRGGRGDRHRRQPLASADPRPDCGRGRPARADRSPVARQRRPLRPLAGLGRARGQRDDRGHQRRGRRRRVAEGETEVIFEPGIRGSRRVRATWCGLGLALARRLARTAGGEIVAQATRPVAGSACGCRSRDHRLASRPAAAARLRRPLRRRRGGVLGPAGTRRDEPDRCRDSRLPARRASRSRW